MAMEHRPECPRGELKLVPPAVWGMGREAALAERRIHHLQQQIVLVGGVPVERHRRYPDLGMRRGASTARPGLLRPRQPWLRRRSGRAPASGQMWRAGGLRLGPRAWWAARGAGLVSPPSVRQVMRSGRGRLTIRTHSLVVFPAAFMGGKQGAG